MTDRVIGFALLVLLGFAVLGGTATIAYILKRRVGRRMWIIPTSGLVGPVLVMIAAIVFVATDDPDGPPPGMVLLGTLQVAAILTPLTLLASWLVVRLSRQP